MRNSVRKKTIRVLICLMLAVLFSGINVHAHATENPKAQLYGLRASASDLPDITADPFTYRGKPLKFKSFLAWPNLTFEQGYNDNVLATHRHEQGDFFTTLKPELLVIKNWSRHQLSARFNAEIIRFWDLKDENVENYSTTIQADLEARRGLNMPVQLSYRDTRLKRRNQRRANVAELTTEPLRVKSFEAGTGIIYKPNRLSLSLLGNYRQARLENAELINGAQLMRDNGDSNTVQGKVKILYEVETGWKPFLETTFAQEDFVNETLASMSRNNDLFRVLAGASFDFKGLLYGSFGLGWENRSYEESTINDASEISLEATTTWEPTAKSLLTLDLFRQTSEDNELSLALTRTYAGLELSHELQRNLFLKTSIAYETEEFDDVMREDKLIDAGIGLHYIIGPHIQLSADYDYFTRESNLAGLSLDNSVVYLRARAAF